MAGDRDAFIGRIRTALGRADNPPSRTPPVIDDALVRLCDAGPSLVDRFAERSAASGRVVHRTHADAVPGLLAELLRDRGARAVTLGIGDETLAAYALQAARDASATVIEWRHDDGLSAHFDVDAGITDVAAAVAETGSLVLGSGPDRGRGAFLVPPLHVALVPESSIVPDLLDLWPADGPAHELPAATVLVTGPSKTADIEGILITGVHGPREVHVVIVEGV